MFSQADVQKLLATSKGPAATRKAKPAREGQRRQETATLGADQEGTDAGKATAQEGCREARGRTRYQLHQEARLLELTLWRPTAKEEGQLAGCQDAALEARQRYRCPSGRNGDTACRHCPGGRLRCRHHCARGNREVSPACLRRTGCRKGGMALAVYAAAGCQRPGLIQHDESGVSPAAPTGARPAPWLEYRQREPETFRSWAPAAVVSTRFWSTPETCWESAKQNTKKKPRTRRSP